MPAFEFAVRVAERVYCRQLEVFTRARVGKLAIRFPDNRDDLYFYYVHG